MTTYAKGTRLGDVPEFDRSQHVEFYCPAHPHTVWISKDPERSRWFTASDSPTPHEFCWHDQKCRFPLGDYLINAQGEDVVAGVRTPQPVIELKTAMPAAYKELDRIRTNLEKHFKDMQDFEFTIEDGVVYMLQTRNGKRTAMAALKFSVDMYKEKLIDWQTAIMRNPADQLELRGLAREARGSGRTEQNQAVRGERFDDVRLDGAGHPRVGAFS